MRPGPHLRSVFFICSFPSLRQGRPQPLSGCLPHRPFLPLDSSARFERGDSHAPGGPLASPLHRSGMEFRNHRAEVHFSQGDGAPCLVGLYLQVYHNQLAGVDITSCSRRWFSAPWPVRTGSGASTPGLVFRVDATSANSATSAPVVSNGSSRKIVSRVSVRRTRGRNPVRSPRTARSERNSDLAATPTGDCNAIRVDVWR